MPIQTTLHYSALRTGLAFAPATIAVLAANLLASRITTAIGNRRAIAAAAALMAASLAGLLVIGASTGYPVMWCSWPRSVSGWAWSYRP